METNVERDHIVGTTTVYLFEHQYDIVSWVPLSAQ